MRKITKYQKGVIDNAVRVFVVKATGRVYYTMIEGWVVNIKASTFKALMAQGMLEKCEETAYKNIYRVNGAGL